MAPGHDRHRVAHREVLGVDHRDALAQPVDMDAVGDLEHMRHVVRDEDDRQPAALHVQHQLEHPAALLDAERGGRLVHDHHPAAEGGGAGHGDALTLAARERFDRLVDVLDQSSSPSSLSFSRATFCHPAAIEPAEQRAGDARLPQLAAEEHVVGDGERRRLSARSWYTVSMPALRASSGERKFTGLPSSRISPASGTTAPHSALIRGRLAGAIVADHARGSRCGAGRNRHGRAPPTRP